MRYVTQMAPRPELLDKAAEEGVGGFFFEAWRRKVAPGLSHEELAEKLGFKRESIWRWFAKRPPGHANRGDVAEKIGKLFGVAPDQLLHHPDREPPLPSLDEAASHLSTDARRALAVFLGYTRVR